MVTTKAPRQPAAPAKAPKARAAAPQAATKATAPAAPAAPARVKHKLVRDSFTIPKPEYTVLQGLKLRAVNLKRPVKKSELLRAGIAALNAMTDKSFLAALGAVPSLKTGRPTGKAAGKSASKST